MRLFISISIVLILYILIGILVMVSYSSQMYHLEKEYTVKEKLIKVFFWPLLALDYFICWVTGQL